MEKAVLVIVGPTASGKSALSMRLAEKLQDHQGQLEIISMDSALVYRGMDIGTAKPSAAELQQVKHHCIDICEPSEPYSAAKFAQDTQTLVKSIQERGNIPVIVGGTMLYWRALVHGLSEMPTADPTMRAKLETQAQSMGWPALHAELAKVDPITAERLKPNDSQRIQRALEVFLISGKTMSAWQAENPKASGRHDDQAQHSAWHLVSLEPGDRKILHQRIEQRFDQMLDAGFLDEVKRLKANPALHPKLPAIRAVGYRQAWSYLDHQISFAEMREQAITATRQLAKRQLTWLRGISDKTCFDPLSKGSLDQALEYCFDFLTKPQ